MSYANFRFGQNMKKTKGTRKGLGYRYPLGISTLNIYKEQNTYLEIKEEAFPQAL